MRRSRIKSDDECSVGTGALIIYVAMILLASLISFTIINGTEKIVQHTEETAEDARRDSANSVIITGAWVYDGYDDMLFMMEFGAAGDPLTREDITYVLTCTENDGTFYYRAANLGDSNGGSAIYVWRVGDPGPDDAAWAGNINNFEPGGRYFFTLDGGTNADPTSDRCGPVHLDNEQIDANLFIHIPNGQSTHQVLSLSNGQQVGSSII